MRGKVYSPKPLSRYDGITPAYAGKRSRSVGTKSISKDHPRLCGEKIVSNGRSIDALGSPPPMRGKGIPKYHTALQAGITPAYAGKSSTRCAVRYSPRDHPRLCGEKLFFKFPE